MNYLKQLKDFCDLYKLEFPTFQANYHCNLVSYTVFWYNEKAHTTMYYFNENDPIKNCVLFLAKWLRNEENFLKLLNIDNLDCMMV